MRAGPPVLKTNPPPDWGPGARVARRGCPWPDGRRWPDAQAHLRAAAQTNGIRLFSMWDTRAPGSGHLCTDHSTGAPSRRQAPPTISARAPLSVSRAPSPGAPANPSARTLPAGRKSSRQGVPGPAVGWRQCNLFVRRPPLASLGVGRNWLSAPIWHLGVGAPIWAWRQLSQPASPVSQPAQSVSQPSPAQPASQTATRSIK